MKYLYWRAAPGRGAKIGANDAHNRRGIIGTGYMGKCHALAWTGVHAVFDDTPIVRRVMLCEVEEGLARRKADEFGFRILDYDWRR